MYRSVLRACLLALSLAACSSDMLGEDVIEQAKPDGKIAFDVVKVDDGVVKTVLAHGSAPFASRFKQYVPPPELKIAAGDTVSVIIWESGGNGLFGNSLTELSFPAGSAARALLGGSGSAPLGGVPSTPGGLTVSPDMMMLLFGGAAAAAGLDMAATQGQSAQSSTTNTTGTQTGQTAQGTGGLSANDMAAAAQLLGAAGQAGTGGQGGLPANLRSQNIEKLLDLAAQSGRPGTRIPDQQVGSDGAISVPYAGRLEVAGRTPGEVQHAIEGALAGKALDPQVLVVVKRSAANSVSVAGEVVNGARVPLSPGGERLLQVIAAAGGAQAPVHETFVRLSRGGVTASVPLATLVSDPQQDIFAEPGDVLTLVRRPQTFSVFGATGRNTAITFNSDHLSLSEALAKAGGLLDDKADPRAVFLFRYEPVELVKALGQPVATNAPDGVSPVVYRLDLSEAKSYLLARQFPVHDKDTIFVANSRYVGIYRFFTALSQVVGPIETGLLTCANNAC